jgi:GT2 family glycosyltransferase
MEHPLVSVIILTWNHAAFIEGCLRSVLEQTYPNIEVIVVDNDSDDDTLAAARAAVEKLDDLRHSGCVRLLEAGRNRGCAGGNNFAARQARGAVLVFLNPDTQVDYDWLEHLVRPLLERKNVGITGAKIYYPGTRTFQHAGGILHKNAMCAHRGDGKRDTGQFDTEAEVDYVTGASLAIRRDLFLYIGGFDEDYNPAYYEESDLCWRVAHREYKVLYVPSAVLWHEEGSAVTKFSPRFYWLNYRNRIRFLLKNYSLWKWLVWFLPKEIQWYRYRESRGYRLLQWRAYGAGVLYGLGKLTDLLRSRKQRR